MTYIGWQTMKPKPLIWLHGEEVIAMKKEKIKKLEKQGWKIGSVTDFFQLSREGEAGGVVFR